MQNFSEKVEVATNEQHGRHLKASMLISPGEMILEEKPLLIAPDWECEQMKCSKCFRDSFVMCSKCQVFPLCIDCTAHDPFECEFFCTHAATTSKNLLVKNYAIFAALRLLLLMENTATSDDCDAILTKPAKLNDYRDSELWQEHEQHVVAPLLQSGIANCFKRVKVDRDFLHLLCIQIDANAFEVTNKDGDNLKGVYVCGAKFPHNCVPNTVIALDDEFKMQIYAAVPIKSGETIYNSYANPLMGTSQRQHYLRMTRHMDCTCQRCLDPTELGSHMSSMKCKNCTDGFAVCDLSAGGNGNWICNNSSCKAVMEAITVHKLLAEVGEAMVNANGDLAIYENLLAKYAPHFHENHFLIIDMKQNIATILRAILSNPMCSPGKKVLERRVQLCEQILPVVRAVVPGISKLYAIALYEYLLPFVELAELEFKDKDITKESYFRKLQMAQEIANDAMGMLSFEPPNSPEGHLAQRIAMEQKRIADNLKKFTLK